MPWGKIEAGIEGLSMTDINDVEQWWARLHLLVLTWSEAHSHGWPRTKGGLGGTESCSRCRLSSCPAGTIEQERWGASCSPHDQLQSRTMGVFPVPQPELMSSQDKDRNGVPKFETLERLNYCHFVHSSSIPVWIYTTIVCMNIPVEGWLERFYFGLLWAWTARVEFSGWLGCFSVRCWWHPV